MFLLLEMAHKTKTTLIRAAQEKIRKANAQRAREVREKIEKKTSRKSGNDEGRREKSR